MTFSFRPARRSEAKPLIGLYAESGCGKTYGALLLARGFAGDGKIGMIETEAGRGEAYADLISDGYDIISLRNSFSPLVYAEAISAGEKANLGCLIIDSASHEWEGLDGVLDAAAKNQEAGRKGALIWQRPKMEHSRHFMLRLMQTPIPLVIVCMRAHYPMCEVIKDGKKEWARSHELKPKQADDILSEMFVHGWIDREHRLHVTKLTRPDLATVFLDKQPITLDTGKRLAAWAKGDQTPTAQDRSPRVSPAADPSDQASHVPTEAPADPRDVPSFHTDNGSAGNLSAEDQEWDQSLAAHATGGVAVLQEQWSIVPAAIKKRLKSRLDTVHKPIAIKADL